MALFSFRHSVKTFSERRTDESRAAKSGQTAAHLQYITRPKAARVVIQERLAKDTHDKTAMHAENEAERRKGRVCERFVIALPLEATPEQREALTRAFAERLSLGVAGYVAAIHDLHGNDVRNPHAHFVFFDVQQKISGRGRPRSTLGLSHKNAIQNAAKMWAELHNEKMRFWGYGPETDITHLSFIDRGIDKIPMIHEGASARATPEAKKTSKEKWKRVDQGHTRAEANAIIREINLLKEEHRNAGTIRLGTSDGNDKAQRDGSIAEQRACGGRNGQAASRDRQPFEKDLQPIPYNRPIGNRSGATKPPLQRFSQPRPNRGPELPPFARLGLVFRLRRGRVVRRVFHELIMLRDTLRAQILRVERQSPLYGQTIEQKVQVPHPTKKTKPHQNGEELGA